MGVAFKFFGKGFAESLLQATLNPFVGLFIGILATSIIQSSSTTTSLAVGLVAAGGLSIEGAIPIIMGANIGTTITNTLVSVVHLYKPDEMRRAFAAATIHDWFNIFAVIVFFPLQLLTNIIGVCSEYFANIFSNIGGFHLFNPIQFFIKPSLDLMVIVIGESGILLLVIALIMLFLSLRYMVFNLKILIIGKVEAFFDQILFKTDIRSILIGMFLTILVQSSSITTSMAVPLAGAGILSLRQIYPFTLGANVGTTVTAMLAAMVTGNIAAVTVAFAHFFFNVFGIFVFMPLNALPLYCADKLALLTSRSKLIPFIYIIVVFFLIPLLLIYLLE